MKEQAIQFPSVNVSPEALEKDYIKNFNRLKSHLQRKWKGSLNEADCDDVVQETLVELYLKYQAGEKVECPTALAYTIGHRKAAELWRKKVRRGEVDSIEVEEHHAIAPRDDHGRSAFLDMTKELPERLRVPVILIYVAQLNVSEVADLLGIAISEVSKREQEARTRLAPLFCEAFVRITHIKTADGPDGPGSTYYILKGIARGFDIARYGVVVYSFLADAWNLQYTNQKPQVRVSKQGQYRASAKASPRYTVLVTARGFAPPSQFEKFPPLGQEVLALTWSTQEALRKLGQDTEDTSEEDEDGARVSHHSTLNTQNVSAPADRHSPAYIATHEESTAIAGVTTTGGAADALL